MENIYEPCLEQPSVLLDTIPNDEASVAAHNRFFENQRLENSNYTFFRTG